MSEQSDELILVDEHDNAIGFASKLAAHQDGGKLHRAFSIFIFDASGRMLLQKRAAEKYHFGGLWTNACCSHPRRGEKTLQAAHRRLSEELGFDVVLNSIFSFIYRAEDPGSRLTEHEYDHVFVGRFEGKPNPDPDEVAEFKWVEPNALLADVAANPLKYTPWFSLIVQRVVSTYTA